MSLACSDQFYSCSNVNLLQFIIEGLAHVFSLNLSPRDQMSFPVVKFLLLVCSKIGSGRRSGGGWSGGGWSSGSWSGARGATRGCSAGFVGLDGEGLNLEEDQGNQKNPNEL